MSTAAARSMSASSRISVTPASWALRVLIIAERIAIGGAVWGNALKCLRMTSSIIADSESRPAKWSRCSTFGNSPKITNQAVSTNDDRPAMSSIGMPR